MKAQSGIRGHVSAALSPGMTQHQLYRRLGGSQGWSGQVQKILPPQRFNPQTLQPIESCFAGCADLAHHNIAMPNAYD
jgi:hypothetical protein